MKQKEAFASQKESERRAIAEKNQHEREKRVNTIHAIKSQKTDIAAQEAARMKEERQQHEEMIRMQKNAEQAKAQSMKQMIRIQKEEQVKLRLQEKDLKR